MAKTKPEPSVHPNHDRQLLDPMLAEGIQAMLDTGFEPDELARRTVRLIIQIAGEKYANIIFGCHRKSRLSPVFTPERLRADQEKLEACWGGKAVQARVRQSLEAMARAAADAK